MARIGIKTLLCLLCIFCAICGYNCVPQSGPDPWNYEGKDLSSEVQNDINVPPDLRIYPKKKPAETSLGTGEWFFKRMLSIVLKGGQIKKTDDGRVEVSLQMRLDDKQWETLEEYTKTTNTLSEDMYRRSVGYVEQAIYKPSVADQIVMAWSDYIGIYLIEYKTHITWTLAMLSISGAVFWLWGHMSHKHVVILIFMILYLYEVFVSYKEAEKAEVDRFLAAVNTCKWYFWTSQCDVPTPDPLIFLKHMNPLKIGIRMFSTLISEPMIVISDTLKTLVHGITDGLWYPFDKIVYGILIITFNVLLLFVLIMVVFNYILNIPFNVGFLFGLVSVNVEQRNRTLFPDSNRPPTQIVDRPLSNATLDKILDVCSQALNTAQSGSQTHRQITNSMPDVGMRRSASTGRLPNISSFETKETQALVNVRRRNVGFGLREIDGSGDHSRQSKGDR